MLFLETAGGFFIFLQMKKRQRKFLKNISFWSGEGPVLIRRRDFLFYRADIRGKYLVKQRMEVFRALKEEENVTVITTIGALMDGVRPPLKIDEEVFSVRTGETSDLEELVQSHPQWDMTGKYRLKGRGSLRCVEELSISFL